MTRQEFLDRSVDTASSLGMWIQSQGVSESAASNYLSDWLLIWDMDNAGNHDECGRLAEAFAQGYCRTVV
jgi:hypothetical protein